MIVLIRLESGFYTDEQNQYCFDNMIECKWDLPIIPRIGEWIELESFIELPGFDVGLSWTITNVWYRKIGNKTVPTLFCEGE